MTKYAFTVELCVKEFSSGDPLAFKMDGHRFDGAQRTLKWSTDQTYAVKITTKPATEVTRINVNGNDLDVTKEKLGVFSGNWNTAGAEVSKRGTRFPLIFLVNFAPEGQMRVEFQSKVYSKNDSHAVWGHKMNSVEFKCSGDDDGYVKIVDESYK
ncbi:hypothetical protein GCK72_006809 [Caenorhabditis remanei]|uniref:CB1 cannabinoid receptor-interacting protein 1 n=2 Tax=Caenorhabditis TaxID=6237 RepID=E3M1Z3_CAERE|nr:hypothetical protein GCK72_006809 [Caenorhabditis remanei]EFO88831.1 hypothetical protein CRE_06649 [Caenorhabditis remanei]KAF1766851.1 hypothetical protein GCK72_006809 [Caenorhabditis remanei]